MSNVAPILFGYARVSTEDQELRLQIQALTAAGVSSTRIYSDKASGAAGTHRRGFEAAIKALRKGDTLVVWELSRLGRDLGELLKTVKRIEEKQANLRILTMAIDTSTPGGQLIFAIFGAVAQFERALIVERTNAGLAAARAEGRIGGRKRSFVGEAEEKAKAMWREGKSRAEIARAAGVSRSLIYERIQEWAKEEQE